MMIAVSMIVFILIPLFMFFINILYIDVIIGDAKDCLEISSINTYMMIDTDSLGEGIVKVDLSESEKYFLENFKQITVDDKFVEDDANVSITISNGTIKISSNVNVTGLDKSSVTVYSNTEFLIDPLLGGEK